MRFPSKPSFGARCAIIAGLSCALTGVFTPAPAYADLSADLAAARAQLEQIGSEYAAINGEIAQLGSDLQATSKQIEETSGRLNSAKDELADYAVYGYKEGGVSLTKAFVNAESLGDVISNLFYMAKVSTAQANLIGEVRTLQTNLEDQQAVQEEAMRGAEDRLAAQAESQARAAELVSSLDARLQEQLAAEAAANAAVQQALQAAEDNENAESSVNEVATGQQPVQDQVGAAGSSDGPGSDPADSEQEEPGQQQTSGDQASGQSEDPRDDQPASGNSGQPAPQPSAPSKPEKPSAGGNGGTSSTGSSALSVALQFEGSPYAYGGATPETGFDCSGLTMYAYAQVGVSLPHDASAQMSKLQREGRFTTSMDELQYGDLVFFPGHVAFYVGNGNCYGARRPGVPASTTKMAYFGAFLGGGNF